MIAATIAVLLALPALVLRRETARDCYGALAAVWLLAWVLRLRAPGLDTYGFFAALAVISLAIFSSFLAAGRHVRWSAGRAAVLAALVYGLTVPAMLRTPIDGDEPFYLLITESIRFDGDLDLANQYRTLERTASGRTDLQPQPGDPVGPRGEQFSRHEPFLALLMLPGYAVAGLPGAIATIALFGVLLVRSTVRWMEDEGIEERAIRGVFPFFAFAPPILFYATRIWPEVPAAFFFVEALRGVRNGRAARWLPSLLGLVLLKLRFLLVAAGLVAALAIRRRLALRTLALAAGVAVIPLAVMWIVSGDPTNVHDWTHLLPAPPELYARGLGGLLADGMSGIAFKAPLYLLGLSALTFWFSRRTPLPEGFRLGMLAASLYVIYLVPRPEWFGGWAPPLRYLVFLMPVLALGAAAVWERVPRGAVALLALWTVGLTIHGVTYPWRLFHIANGENQAGEWLSMRHAADFSRLFPSFIRLNDVAWTGVAAVVVLIIVLVRQPVRHHRIVSALWIAALSLVIGAGFVQARRPAGHVEFEDAHVAKSGGELYPELYRVMRVVYRGGWVLNAGDSLSFLAQRGEWTLDYVSGPGATIRIGETSYHLAAGPGYQTARVSVQEEGRVTLHCLDGAVNLDRMRRDAR